MLTLKDIEAVFTKCLSHIAGLQAKAAAEAAKGAEQQHQLIGAADGVKFLKQELEAHLAAALAAAAPTPETATDVPAAATETASQSSAVPAADFALASPPAGA